MRFTTSTGYALDLQRIARQRLDLALVHAPPPTPPVLTVPVFGGITEQVANPDDPGYQADLLAYYLRLYVEQMALFLTAVTLAEPRPANAEFAALLALGLVADTDADFIRTIALSEPVDQRAVSAEILYLSTTTQRGVNEWVAAFNVRWHDNPVLSYTLPPSPAEWSNLYADREAARFAGLTWPAFCALPGPEQSGMLAHYLCAKQLEGLIYAERKH